MNFKRKKTNRKNNNCKLKNFKFFFQSYKLNSKFLKLGWSA